MSHRLVSDKRRAWTQAFSSLSPCFQLLHCTASVLLQTLGCYWFTISVSLNFSYFNQSDLTFSVLFLFEIQLKSFFGKTQVCFLFIHFSHLVVSDSATRWTVARQAPLYVNFSRQKFWSGLPFPSPGHLPDAGIEPWVFCSADRFFTFWATRAVELSPHDTISCQNCQCGWMCVSVCSYACVHAYAGMCMGAQDRILKLSAIFLWTFRKTKLNYSGHLADGHSSGSGIPGIRVVK